MLYLCLKSPAYFTVTLPTLVLLTPGSKFIIWAMCSYKILLAESCINKYPHCINWAQKGECKKNSPFMMANCRRSCANCGKYGGPQVQRQKWKSRANQILTDDQTKQISSKMKRHGQIKLTHGKMQSTHSKTKSSSARGKNYKLIRSVSGWTLQLP